MIHVPQAIHDAKMIADFLCEVGKYKSAISAYQICLKVSQFCLGEFHPKVADCYYSLAVAEEKQANFQIAQEDAEKCLKLRQDAFGASTNCVEIADSYMLLGLLFKKQGYQK